MIIIDIIKFKFEMESANTSHYSEDIDPFNRADTNFFPHPAVHSGESLSASQKDFIKYE
jgi:hypothetical protein